MKTIKIGIVSYLNTLPFVCGIKQWKSADFKIEMVFAYPSRCSELLENNEVDIALIPTGALERFPNHKIITDYCIGSYKKVETVLLLSDVPMNEITEIYLDYQSNTSVKLIQILAKHFWHITPKMQQTNQGFESKIANTTAGLIIGDRAFDAQKRHRYSYDLSEEWHRYMQLPFVFAVWLAKTNIPQSFVSSFNHVLQYGIEHISECIDTLQDSTLPKSHMLDYLTKKIAYQLDADKQFAIRKFLELSHSL